MSVLTPAVVEERGLLERDWQLTLVLRELNRIRRRAGLDALFSLPPGRRRSARSCVLRRALADVGVHEVGLYPDGVLFFWGKRFAHTRYRAPVLRDFVLAFDEGEFPDLVEMP